MLLISCKDVAQLISESLDRELSPLQRLAVRLHLFYCRFCSRYQRQILFIRDAINRYSRRIERGEVVPPTSLPPEARQRIRESLTRRES